MTINNNGSVYDKFINEDWFNTPDMNEYYNNRAYLDNIKGMSPEDNEIQEYFYAEDPPVLESGYYDNLGVVAAKIDVSSLGSAVNALDEEKGSFDGDTLYFNVNSIIDSGNAFKLYYSDKVFSGVKDYVKKSIEATKFNTNDFGLRFIGINTPEIVHKAWFRSSLLEDDLYTVKYENLSSSASRIYAKNKKTGKDERFDKKQFNFSQYKLSGDTYIERSPDEIITFVRKIYDKKSYPNYMSNERDKFHEVVRGSKNESEKTEGAINRLVVISAVQNKTLEYYNQGKKAQALVRDMVKSASECIVLLDTVGLNGKKKGLPSSYKKYYELHGGNPFFAIYDMWNTITGKRQPAYKYAGYNIPGQESNGRFLSAVYLKVPHNGKSQWINLNKKVLADIKMTELASFTDSVESTANYGYNAPGFRLWTYRHKDQIFVDHINKLAADTRDDRYKIQSEISGCNIDNMAEHTVMIGDTLLMVPPTSIKVVNQTKTAKVHLVRAKGAINKTLPRTERVIQLDLFFNDSSGINGIPYEQTLPNGEKITYMMNGLRSLIAQFKLTPFLPIHNNYINKTLGIDAVSLVSYSINTVPNFPRALQVTLMMYEFEWIQYMPNNALPSVDEGLYTNGYSNTIYFPLLRWHYQKAIKRGEILRPVESAIDPTYIKSTLGNVTALQPMKFDCSEIKFFVPSEDLLSYQKQMKIEMAKNPLGNKIKFNDEQLKFASAMNSVGKMFSEMRQSNIVNLIKQLTNPSDKSLKAVFPEPKTKGKTKLRGVGYNLPVHINNKNNVIVNANDIKKTIVNPIIDNFNLLADKYKTNFFNAIKTWDVYYQAWHEKGSYYYKIIFQLDINKSLFKEEDDLDKIKIYLAKHAGLNKDSLFIDDSIQIEYVAKFKGTGTMTPLQTGMEFQDNDTIKAVNFLGNMSDIDGEGNISTPEINDNIKDSLDTEDHKTIKFFHYDIGCPHIANVSAGYNNMFANVGLKAIDGHAAQYTGASDSTLEIVMEGDEYSAGQFQLLNRVCMDYLIKYRKVLKSAPLRIDSDITRMLGIYEVILDSVQIETIPNAPGRFSIILTLTSADRTLRNRENLIRIKDMDNHSEEGNESLKTKGYMDLNKALSQAELYPDLELPTVEETEKAGFYFMKSKYTPTQKYVEPDFYFMYWYPSLAETIRTSIVEYFSNPENIKLEMSDNISSNNLLSEIDVDKNVYKILNWKDVNKTYDKLQEQAAKIVQSVDGFDKLTPQKQEGFKNYFSKEMIRFNKIKDSTNKLQELIEIGTQNSFTINNKSIVSVADVNVNKSLSEKNMEKISRINNSLRWEIKEYLKKEISPHAGDNDSFSSADDNNLNFGRYRFIDKLYSIILDGAGEVDGTNALTMKDRQYIRRCIRAAVVGAMSTFSYYDVDAAMKESPNSPSKAKFPKGEVVITNKSGKKEKVPLCLYRGESDFLIAHNEETRSKGVIFGIYGIKKYNAKELSAITGRKVGKSGFLDPYVNPEMYSIIYGGEKLDLEKANKRISKYKENLLKEDYFGGEAHFRNMMVHFYLLLLNKTYLNNAFMTLEPIKRLSNMAYRNPETVYNYLTTGTSSGETVIKTATGKTNIYKSKDLYNKLVNKEAKEEIDNIEDEQKDRLDNMLKLLDKHSVEYGSNLMCGLIQTLSAIALSGSESSILSAVKTGSIESYANIAQSSKERVDMDNISDEELRLTRFFQFCDLDDNVNSEDSESNPIIRSSYNNKIQRAYLQAANDPKTYMLHSYYDMVMHDRRGTMARAFPTYYMLLIDEGRKIGLWRLQDNFYDMHSIVEYEVVKSRKIAADTARIVMSNSYGIFTSDDEDMKTDDIYTVKDVWDSVFSPRKYFEKEYARRKDAREINRTKMQPGARVHLRMGYGSNAATLPILFNGCVTECEAGDVMTLICQGDGVELANPNMFTPADSSKDMADLKHENKVWGARHFMQFWNDLSSPRDLLVTPLAAEGTFLHEMIKELTSGRFFNSNPYGIVHFGDRKYQEIFRTNGEVEQNIYEALGKPTFDYENAGIETMDDGLDSEYALDEAPRVRVNIEQGLSYWDVMGIAASLTPDFICAIAPFQLRSTIFHGHPRYYYAYDYIQKDGKVLEKRKPYQQYHVYDSYNDIIDNRITASPKDIRTNAMGYYTGPGWVTTKTKAIGPLFIDIDIYPEFQKSTSFDLKFQYKNNDISPGNVPIVSKVVDLFGGGNGPNGDAIAWRAVANGLKGTVKDMYQGEVLILGDPTIKPYDRFILSDSYEDMGGTMEVESVIHMFNSDSGFTTAIKPDCIAAIETGFENISSGFNKQIIAPALTAAASTSLLNLHFNRVNRMSYLGASTMSKKGINFGIEAFNSIANVVGKNNLAIDALNIGSAMPTAISEMLGIADVDVKVYDAIKKISSATRGMSKVNITGGASLVRALNSLDDIALNISSVNKDSISSIKSLLSDPRYSNSDALKLLNEMEPELLDGVDNVLKSFKLDQADLKGIRSGIGKITDASDEMKALAKNLDEIIASGKSVDLISDKKFRNSLRALGKVDDFTSASGFGGLASKITRGFDVAETSAKVLTKVDNVASAAVSSAKGLANGAKGLKASLKSTLIYAAIDIILTKTAQDYFTKKIRNLQCLTIYPVMKDNMVFTAGLTGHMGSVYGSLTYDQPGWLEKMAIKFFDYGTGSGDPWHAKILGFLRDTFLTTDEMRKIVDSFRRGEDYLGEAASDEKNRLETENSILAKISKENMMGYADYRQIHLTDRLTRSQINNKDDEARIAYAKYKMPYIDNIETTKEIAMNLVNILTNQDGYTIKDLYDKGLFLLANNEEVEEANFNLVEKKIMLNETTSEVVKVKEIKDKQGKIIYDIPYLRRDAFLLLNHVVEKVVDKLEPNYDDPTCEYENLKKHPIIFHSGTRLNSDLGWRSTGFLFTIEVKNYENMSNIIDEITKEHDKITLELYKKEIPFSIKKEKSSEYGVDAISFFLHCPVD